MKRLIPITLSLILISFCACSSEESQPVAKIDTQFESELNEFCDEISSTNAQMNSFSSIDERSVSKMLALLDDLNSRFGEFGSMDFPEDYDYLETYAREASEYMKEAVSVYHEIYTPDGYDSAKDEYASENYKRAFKRVKVIIAVLRGENPNEQ